MNTPLQQRIVGAIVLVALGVIFIPAILDGSGYRSRHTQTVEIPAKPDFPAPSQQRVAEIPTPIDERLAAVERDHEREPESKPAELKSWVLQVGTFDSEDNALKLRDELRGMGYTTHVSEQASRGKTTYRVRIGPDISKDRLETQQATLKKQGIDGFIQVH